MYGILVAHVWKSKLTPESFLCPKEHGQNYAPVPLLCQIDKRDVYEEGKPELLPVLRRGGVLPPDTSLGGEDLTANVMAYTRPVVPVLVEIIPAT